MKPSKIFHSIRVKLALYVFLSCGLTFLVDIGILALIRTIQIKITNITSIISFFGDPVQDIQLIKQLGPAFWILLGMASVVVFIIFYIILTAPMVSYLREILSGVERIKNGDLETEIPIRANDELTDLGRSINMMRLELKTTREKEHEAERIKDELVTNVAHDLRTPLTSIIGYLELLRMKKDLSEEQRAKYLSIAYDKSERMRGLVTDLFDYTRFEKDKIQITKSKLELKQFMEQIVDEFYPELMEKQLECYTAFTSEYVYIDGDGELLARAFGNLVGNAIKYGAEGKQIRIEIGLLSERKKARVAIVNYGKIIPKKDLEHIFDKFYRGDAARSTTGGTGLGLAIAKNIFEMHGGTIQATSSEQGTVFQVILPLVDGKEMKNED